MPTSSDYIFISYSRTDKQQVLAAVAALKSSGHAVWIDDKDIPVSVPWLDEITDAIRGAALVLAFNSWTWYSSGACASELNVAESLGVAVVHVDAESTSPQEILALVDSRLADRRPAQRDRTEVLTRAANWRRSDKPKRLLARGRSLTKFINAAASDRSLPPDVHAYVAAGKKRRTRERWLAVGGSLVLTLAVQMAGLASRVNDGVLDRIVEANASLAVGALQSEVMTYNTYAGMDFLAVQSSEGYGPLHRMAEVLSVPVPIQVLDEPSTGSSEVRPEVATNQVLAPLVANKLCWSLDSAQKLLAVCDQATQSLSVYDASTGVLVTSSFIPDMGAYASFSPDARLLAVGSGPNIALIGVAGTSGSSIMLRGSLGPIRNVGFSEDGLSIWGTTEGAKRVIWDVPGGRTISYDPGFWTIDSASVASDTAAGEARVAVLSRDGKVVVTGPAEVQVQPWQISGTSTSIAAHSAEPIVAVSSIDGGSGEINLFELKKPEKKRFDLGACQPVDSVFGSNQIYVACSDSDVIEIDYTSGEIRKLDLGIFARSVAVTRDRLLVGDFYGMVRQVSEDKKSATVIADGCLHAANRLVATPDGRYAFNSGLSANNPRCLARIRIPTSEDGPARHSLVIGAGMAAETRGVAVSPDSKLIAYGYADGTVTIFDTEMLNPTSVHPGLGSEVRGLTFGEDGRSLILATRDGRIASIDVSEDYLSVGEKRALLRQRADRAVEMGLYQRSIEFQDASVNKRD